MRRARMLASFTLVLLLLFCKKQVIAITPTGNLEFFGQVEIDQGLELLSSPLHLSISLEEYLKMGAKAHLTALIGRDFSRKDYSFQLEKAYLQGYFGNFDYTIGLQSVNWGTADAFSPTNYFSETDTTKFMKGKLTGDSFWGGQLAYSTPKWSATIVTKPYFKGQEVDWFLRRMMLKTDSDSSLLLSTLKNVENPPSLLKNGEFAARLETQLAGFDVQLSYFYGYENLPGAELVYRVHPKWGIPLGLHFRGTYRRQQFFGLATAGTIGPLGVWTDLRYGGPKPFPQDAEQELIQVPFSINQNYLFAVAGLDYTLPLGKGLLTQLQYLYQGQGSLLLPYGTEEQLSGGKHYLFSHFNYPLSSDLIYDLTIIHGLTEKNGIIRQALSYRLANFSSQLDLGLLVGYSTKKGSSDSSFSPQLVLGYTFYF